MEDRCVPAVVYNNTFDWNGVASVTATVTDDNPSYPGQYHWSYHVTNVSFASGIGTFALPAEEAGMVSNLGNSLGWAGSVGALLGNPDLVSWQAMGSITPPPPGSPPSPPPPPVPLIGVGGSADFWFTTAPVDLALSNGFVADLNLTAPISGLLAIPTANAPVPPQTLSLMVASKANTDDKLLTLRDAIDKINRGLTDRGQVVTDIRFAKSLTGQTITLNSQLPEIRKTMNIYGEVKNVTVTRDVTQGNFRLFKVGNSDLPQLPVVTISNLTLKGGGGTMGNDPVDEGGAILSYANLVLTGCTIRDNIATFGGGIRAQGGTLDITNCDIFYNTATDGGGIYIAQYVTAANISGGSIHHNQATGTPLAAGGGIFILGGEDVPISILGVHIYENTARFAGGGICVWNNQGEGGSPQLTLGNNTVVESNFATGTNSKGGGVYLGAGTLTLGAASITGNGAVSGGGLYLVTGTSWNGDPFGYIWNNLPDNVFQES